MLFKRAQKLIPGGVNSPVRAFTAVDTFPAFIARASGSKLYDVDGNAFVDYVCSWGANIVGHAHPEIVAAVTETAQNGMGFGAPTEYELALAEKILAALPGMEQLRLVTSGTEACMTALRLARGYTNRCKFIKFAGNYHGHSDSLLVNAGSGPAAHSISSSKGVVPNLIKDTLTAEYNSSQAVKDLVFAHKGEIAAIILEPVVGNSGFILPNSSFLNTIRQICTDEGILLIFDEVMTGFRVAWGGAQTIFGIQPDLSTLGKVIGGGLPIGALAGRAEIMSLLSPCGEVYQAGTLAGNPIAVSCGLKTLEILERAASFPKLASYQEQIVAGISKLAIKHCLPLQASGLGGIFGIFFSEHPVANFADAKKSCQKSFQEFFGTMFASGIYLPPSRFEACFVSLAHDSSDLSNTLSAVDHSFAQIANSRNL